MYIGTQPADTPSGGADPHFVSPLKNGENLCFSVQGIPEFIFNLFSDSHLQLNAKFSLPKAEESRSLVNSSTFIQQLGFIVKSPNTDEPIKIKMSALDHSVTTTGNVMVITNHPTTINVTNNNVKTTINTVSVTPAHDETAWVSIITDVGFSLKVKFVKRHIDFVITESHELTAQAHGIQGKCILN